MRRITFIICLLLTLTSILSARPKYYFNIGMTKPFAPEDFLTNWRSGYQIGAGIGFMLGDRLEIIPGLYYSNFSLNDANFLSGYLNDDEEVFSSVTGGTTNIFDVSADLKYVVPTKSASKITPYLIGGVGFASHIVTEKNITTSTDPITEEKQSNQIACAGAGIGFEFIMGKNTYFVVEGRFNMLFTDETTVYAPIKLGIMIK